MLTPSMSAPIIFCFALVLISACASSTSALRVSPPPKDTPTTNTLLITSYIPITNPPINPPAGTTYYTANASLLDVPSGEVTSAATSYVRPPFPVTQDMDITRDSALYVANIESVFEFHVETVPQKKEETRAHSNEKKQKNNGKVSTGTQLQTNFRDYNFYLSSSTFIFPIPGLSLVCTIYDPDLDLVFGLSSEQVGEDYNISLVTLEYNGDYYTPIQLAWSGLYPAPAESTNVGGVIQEQPLKPPCSYDSLQRIFSFHWRETEVGGVGQIVNLNFTYIDYTPLALFLNSVPFPQIPQGTLGEIQSQHVLTFESSAYIGTNYIGLVTYSAYRYVYDAQQGQSNLQYYAGIINPLTGQDVMLNSPIDLSGMTDFSVSYLPKQVTTYDPVQQQTYVLLMTPVYPYQYWMWYPENGTILDGQVEVGDWTGENPVIVGVSRWYQ